MTLGSVKFRVGVAGLLGVLLAVWAGPLAGGTSSAPLDLQQLIDEAQPGAVITLGPGPWQGGVTIDKPLSLLGGGLAVIDGGGQGSVIAVSADDVTLQGLIIRNSGNRLDREDAGITTDFSSGLRVVDNRLENVLFGMFLRHANQAVVSENFIGGMELFIARRGDGIRMWQSSGALVENNVIANGRDTVFWFADQVTVRGNHVADSRYGLHFMYSDGAVVEGNLLENNSVGAFLMYSTDLTVLDNVFRNNRGPSGYGMGIKDVDGLLVKGNRFVENRSGFYADNSPSRVGVTHLIEGNVFAYNNVGVLLGSTVARNVFTGNAFIDNAEQAASDSTGGLGDNQWLYQGVGNHWSDFAGFDANGDGIGDMAYQIDNLFTDLVERYPALAFFTGTQAARAIDMASQTFPHLRAEPMLTDESPLIAVPAFDPAVFASPGPSRLVLVVLSLLLLALASGVMMGGRLPVEPFKGFGGTT